MSKNEERKGCKNGGCMPNNGGKINADFNPKENLWAMPHGHMQKMLRKMEKALREGAQREEDTTDAENTDGGND